MFETIAILVIFFFLVAVGFSFYGFIRRVSIEEQGREIMAQRAIDIAEKSISFPEIQCSFDNQPEPNCIDMFKLLALKDKIAENNVYYFPIFGYSRITLYQIYPPDESITFYNMSLADKSILATHIPLTVYHPAKEEYYFSRLLIEVFV